LGVALLLLLGVMLGAAVRRIVHFTRRTKPESPLPSVVPPVPPRSRPCPQCGAELKPDVPEGLCPACLLKHGIATEPGEPAGQAPFVPPDLAELARLFPQLEIIEAIGKGGMGAVYKARQPTLDRFVALKILAPRGPVGDLDFAGRFTREARALARLNHPNIVAVYDFGLVRSRRREEADPAAAQKNPPPPVGGYGEGAPLHYFIMEYVDGPNLRQVQQAGRLEPREALQIIPQICAALQFAHDEGIIHRDIKPENVLLDKKGRVKIADFGLAKILGAEPADFRLTGAKDVMGTPHYMAPEQVEKPQEVDHRADIYSLGVVFYEMLTGELPLGRFPSPSSRMRGMQVDVRLDEVVLRSLEKEPARRYQHVSEMKTQVETIAADAGKPETRPAAPQPSDGGNPKPEPEPGLPSASAAKPRGSRTTTEVNWPGVAQTFAAHAALLLILTVALIKIVPPIVEILAGFNVKLSASTRLVANLASYFRHWWPLVFPLLLALDFLACVQAQRLGGNRARKLWSAAVLLGMVLALSFSIASLGSTWLNDLPRAVAEAPANKPGPPVESDAHPPDVLPLPAVEAERPEPAVTLLAIEDRSGPGIRIWRPDGTEVPDPLRTALTNHGRGSSPGVRWFSVLVSNAPDDSLLESSQTIITTPRSSTTLPCDSPLDRSLVQGGTVFRFAGTELERSRTATVRFGFAVRPWRELLVWENQGDEFELKQNHWPEGDAPGAIRVDEAYSKTGYDWDPQEGVLRQTNLATDIQFDLPARKAAEGVFRLLVVDKEGHEHLFRKRRESWRAPVRPEDIRCITLQGHFTGEDYYWAVFRKVALYPSVAIATNVATIETATNEAIAPAPAIAPSPATNAPPAVLSESELEERYAAAKAIYASAERDRAMSALALEAGKSGQPELARKALAEITSFPKRDDATHRAVRELAKSGHRAAALEIARTITSFTRRDAVLRELANE
jgi:serine/threonine protein kinase